MKITSDQIDIKMSQNVPAGNCGDGVSISNKAMHLLNELYSINTPDFLYSAYGVDGSLKRIAKSGTMCIDEVKSLYDNLKKCGQVFFIQSKKGKNIWPAYWNVANEEKSSSHLMVSVLS